MWNLLSKVRRCLASESGPTAAEYAVMTGLVIMVLIGIISAFGKSVSGQFSMVSTSTFS